MTIKSIHSLLSSKDAKANLIARQWLFLNTPLSRIVELYLYDNEGRPQDLSNFAPLRPIYNFFPRKLLLKCSRKTLKSTLLSNIITLNMIRYNYYHTLYVAPQELATKYFSTSYLNKRFDSKPLRKILPPFIKNDVFEKILSGTNSSILLRYCKDDATRVRGPAVAGINLDEVQDINLDVIPIIKETMAMATHKREIMAGTPLTSDNTINILWKTTNQLEWAMRCPSCNHWNTLTEDNDPMKMIGKTGLCCSKCQKEIDSSKGQWVEFNPKHPDELDLVGYHLAQPLLPHYNNTASQWKEIYNKVFHDNYNIGQIYNEVFGLAYNLGRKPLPEELFKNRLCILGHMPDIFNKNKSKYRFFTAGVDWGVSMETSRTSLCIGALRDDGVYEVFFLKTYKTFDHELHIKDIAERINLVNAFCACDSGPDPIRGMKLMKMTSPRRTQLVRYDYGKLKQRYEIPSGSVDPVQNRWVLHRSDTISFVFELLKQEKILFPQWEDSGECLSDILNVYIEVKDNGFRQDLVYRHSPSQPDDFLHALNYAVCQAHVANHNPLLFSPSSNSEDFLSI